MSKCAYAHCFCRDLPLTKETSQVKSNTKNQRYHNDCLKVSMNLIEFKNVWQSGVNKAENWTRLTMILNRLVFTPNEDYYDFCKMSVVERSEYMLFALRYIISHKFNLNYPEGFKFYIPNDEIMKAYESKVHPKQKPKDIEVTPEMSNETTFVHKTNNKPRVRFGNLFGGL